MSHFKPRRTNQFHRGLWATIGVFIAVCGLAVVFFGALPQTAPSAISPPATTSVSSTSTSASPTPSKPTQAPEPPKKVIPAAAIPSRIQYDAVGIDAPVESCPESCWKNDGRTIEPPYIPTTLYWMPEYGQAGEGSIDTVFIVAHSSVEADYVLNRLANAQVGQIITVTTPNGTLEYKVFLKETFSKAANIGQSEVFAKVPDRLVLITSLLSNLYVENQVVYAQLVR